MNIKDVAEISRIPAKTIRYYEEIGLISPGRAENGYRRFAPHDLHMLAFIGRARSLGFSIEECRMLLSLYERKDRASADIKRIAEAHLRRVRARIAELESMRRTLRTLVASCQGGHRPDYPILDDLADTRAAGEALA